MSLCRLNKSQPLKAFSNKCCSMCDQEFVVKDLTLKDSKWPVLLKCGHSVCDSCLQQNLKPPNEFICQECGFTCEQNELTNLSLNMYLTGYLLANYKYEQDKKLLFLTATSSEFCYITKKQSKKNSNTPVCEECFSKGSWFCENCLSNFCDSCWTKVHGSARILMKHVKIPVSNDENLKSMIKKCSVHETQNLEFYCQGCHLPVCPHCVILYHQGDGHWPITIKDKNLGMTDKVKMAAEEAEIIGKKMKQTLEKIKLTLSSDDPDGKMYFNLEKLITEKFSRLHGILQLEEEGVVKKLREAGKERENCLKNLSVQLESHIENISWLIREYEFFSREPHTGDLTELHQKLVEVKDLPCYLLSQKENDKEVKLVFDDNLVNLLPTYCTLDLPSNEIFELRCGEDLPEDFIAEPIPPSEVDTLGLMPDISEVESLSSLGVRQSDEDATAKPASIESTQKTNFFIERKIYSVRITYIKNPGEFYVALNSQRLKHQSIDKKASQFASNSSDVPETVSKDQIYLVKYKGDGKWYRARIVDVSPDQTEDSVEVYYLDYGNTEKVSISSLRFIPDELMEEDPMAFKCKLFDCIPRKGEWCAESTKVMETMLKNSTVTMFVMKVQSDCLEVDLSKICPKNQIGSEIISVRDSLVFLEFTNLVGGRKKPQVLNPLRYLNPTFPSLGESFEAIVTHINSPSDFYVQKVKVDPSLFYTLSVDLKNFYNSNFDKGLIYNPSVGMPCAAIFSGDKKWYRAKIIDIPGKKMITVLFVDYGNKETVPWTSVRKLKENFCKEPPMALNCSLAEIEPGKSNSRSREIAQYMKTSLLLTRCRILVQGKTKTKQKLKVFLYKKEVCVNALLNMERTVVTCSKLETKDIINETTKTHGNTKNENKLDDDCRFSYENVTKKILKKQKRKRLNAKTLRELHSTKKSNDAESSGSNDNESVESEITPCEDIFKAKVEVLSAESPSCIYVTFPALLDVLTVLQSELDEFYKDSTYNENDEWEVDGKCVVFSSARNGWYRATILELLPEDKVKVFLKDVACVSIENKTSLRVLDPSFSKFATPAVKCHLAGIRPVDEKWPSISCEFLINELEDNKKVYMTRKGEIEEKSLPVELWVRKTMLGSALEPMVKNWATLNCLLVDQGLALPTKPNISTGPSMPSNEDESFSKGNEIDTTGTKKDADEVPKTSDTFIPSFSSWWLPPKKLKHTRFLGIPTYVDYDAFIYIYAIGEDEEQLKTIRTSLAEEYDNLELTPEDHFWCPGQLCIVKYHADNFWYRGVVMEINENGTYEVFFADYGNVETCQIFEMRKRIKMAEIPILTHKFELFGIETVSEDGKWPVSTTDFLHSVIVDKPCEINVVRESLDPEKPSTILLKLVDKGVDVGEFLVNQGLARSKLSYFEIKEMEKLEDGDDFNGDLSKEEPEDVGNNKKDKPIITEGNNKEFVSLKIPDGCEGFYITTTSAVTSQNEFYANIVNNEFLPIELQQVLADFERLQQELMDQCPDQPILGEFREGQPCCYFSLETDKWCRGEVFKESDKSVFVFAVDYGHREYLKKNLLRECKNEWSDVPKMAVKCKLAGVEKCPDVPEPAYITALVKCLKDCYFFVQIVNVEKDFLQVKLYTETDGSLAYQEMIDDGLILIAE